jgi:hypothetical protein
MKTIPPVFIASAVILLYGNTLLGCSTSHEAMRGSVLMTLEDEAHICIGSADGIRVGDVLAVYRFRVDNTWWLSDFEGRFPAAEYRRPQYQEIKVGEAKVIEIFDGHFATVRVVRGELEASDIVEKTRR